MHAQRLTQRPQDLDAVSPAAAHPAVPAGTALQPRPHNPHAPGAVRPPAPDQIYLGVHASTYVAAVDYPQAEVDYQQIGRALVRQMSDNVRCGLQPTPYERNHLVLLLSLRSSSAFAREALARDVLHGLQGLRFGHHSPLASSEVEMHVRTLYLAMALLGKTATGLTFEHQRALITHLSELQDFVRTEDNPTTLFYLSCLRNAVVQMGNDEAPLHQMLRFGIPIGATVAAALSRHPAAAGAAALAAARELSWAGLRPGNWWKAMQALEEASEAITWASSNDFSTVQACDALLLHTQQLLEAESTRLASWSAAASDRIRDKIKRLNVRPVDNAWDLAFACLDKIHQNIFHLSTPQQKEAVLRQLDLVARKCTMRPLRFKALEVLRDLRRDASLRPHCQLLLHALGTGDEELILAVGRKREVEGAIFAQIVNHPQGEFAPGDRQAGPHIRRISLSRRGALRLLPGETATPVRAVPLALPGPGGAVVARTAAPTQPKAPLARLYLGPMPPNAGLQVLRDAIRRGAAEEVDVLLKAGVNVADELRTRAQATGEPATALALACARGHIDVLRVLCSGRGQRHGFLTAAAQAEALRAAAAAGRTDVSAALRALLGRHA